MNILIVEDDLGYATLLQEALAADPTNRVVRVASLSEAIETASRMPTDVVMLDLNLPDSTGLHTMLDFRDAHPTLAIVVTTGGAEAEGELEFLRNGAQEVLLKHEDQVQQAQRLLRRAAARMTIVVEAQLTAEQERERRKRVERDLAWFDDLRSTTTSEVLGIASPLEAAPEVADRLADLYEELLDAAVKRQIYRDMPHPGPKIRAYVAELAKLRAGPREVTDIHSRVLRRKTTASSDGTAELLRSEGRLLLVEVMGYLLSEYRIRSFGALPPSAGADHPRPRTPGPDD